MTELVKSVNCVKVSIDLKNISYSSVEASQILVRADTNEMKLKNMFISTKVSTQIYIPYYINIAYLSQVNTPIVIYSV